ncbi:DUF5106 domain-containing protein [Bacteroides sp. 519]|uniref:DUF5106 domain-containing protein n=1 Tax=Bacteroides sp. 519 TaxID=2302937 RepID=UPI0013D129F5|nr:DUF5106 domain-containing protein [Bacteroides sp. 519]NDV59601.1 DUF5106 domain-containing protein [Bacteroides sp. 519]
MKNIISYLFICFVSFCACKNSNASSANSQSETTETQTDSLKFQIPDVPPMYGTPEQRAEYLANHYWDNYDFTDTCYLNKDITEQAWVDFIQLLNFIQLNEAQNAVKSMYKKAEQKRITFNYFTELAEKYLRDPNSPVRNEEYYIPVLETMIASDSLLDMEKIRPKDRLQLALKNRLGTKALDFTYTLANGKQAKMHSLKSDYILLYFHNPGCHTCGEYTRIMKNSMLINHLLDQKKLTILSIYPDEEVDEWKAHLPELSSSWINGYDKEQELMIKNSYDLKAIPTLYLLDKNKNVLLKDAVIEAVEKYLNQIVSDN